MNSQKKIISVVNNTRQYINLYPLSYRESREEKLRTSSVLVGKRSGASGKKAYMAGWLYRFPHITYTLTNSGLTARARSVDGLPHSLLNKIEKSMSLMRSRIDF